MHGMAESVLVGFASRDGVICDPDGRLRAANVDARTGRALVEGASVDHVCVFIVL